VSEKFSARSGYKIFKQTLLLPEEISPAISAAAERVMPIFSIQSFEMIKAPIVREKTGS
jgi:hypothetical protein